MAYYKKNSYRLQELCYTKCKIVIKDAYIKFREIWSNAALFKFGLAKSDVR